VEKMNGTIRLESRIGQGSRFEILLPDIQRAERQESFYQYESKEFKKVNFKNSTILVVDDIQYNIDTVKKLIESDNLEFTEAQNAEKALEIIKINPPDLVLMDLKLPDMSGYEATALIKSDKRSRYIPVLAFTASAMTAEESQAKTLFDGFIRKPVTKSELYTKLRLFLPHTREHFGDHTIPQEGYSQMKISPDTRSQVISRLENDLMDDWQEIKDNLLIYKIEEFITKMESLKGFTEVAPLVKYDKELKKNLNNFDIEGLQAKIREYPKLIKRIKNL